MNNAEISFKQSELWIRLAVCTNVHIKKAMLRVIHNEINDPVITKLPSDPVQLFSFMVRNKNTLDQARRRKFLNDDQYSDLLPHNKNVDSSKLDITLLRFIIQTFSGITNDEGHWREPKVADLSIAAFIYRAAAIRNRIFHCKEMETLDTTEFEDIWKDIEYILTSLKYNEDIKRMKTQSLDPTLVKKINDDMIKEFLTHLQDYKTECAKEPLHDDYIPRRFRNAQNDTVLLETELEKVLNDNSGLIIHGEAGLGKSVTAKKIKQEWSNGRILKDNHIIFYDSKRINQKIKVRSNAAPLWFSDIVPILKGKGKTIEDLAIFNCVKAAIGRLLIFVDGIDEFPIKELTTKNYVSELEERIQNNEKISAVDTIVGIYFGFLFPNAKVCLLGRTGEFERLRMLKDYPNSSIFDKMNRVDLQLLPFDQANVKEFTCSKICKQKSTNGQTISSCNKLCHEIYDKIKDIELCKIPTDLNALVEMYKNHPNENIGRITKTKLFVATLLNRLNEHTNQKRVIINKTFEENLEDNPKLVEGICVLGEISFNSLLEENVLVKVKDEKIKDIVYFKYKHLMIEREILETLDFFYIRDLKYHNYVLEPHHTTNIEFLTACYLFSHPNKWDLLLELNDDRKLVILPYLAGLFANDYFTRDFCTNVLSSLSYSIEQFFTWLYNIEDIRKNLPGGGEGYRYWYGLSENQKLTPSLYLLDSIQREMEIPEFFIPTKTIVCFCNGIDSFEWYNMKYFLHNILTKLNNSDSFNNIQSFLNKFGNYKFIIKGGIGIHNSKEMKLLTKFYNNDKITFKINDLDINQPLTVNLKEEIRFNTLHDNTSDSFTFFILLSALHAPTITRPTINVKRLCLFTPGFNDYQSEKLFEIGLSGVDVIRLELTSPIYAFHILRILHAVECERSNKGKQINFQLRSVDFEVMLALPSLGTRHVSLNNINNDVYDNVNDNKLSKFQILLTFYMHINNSHKKINFSNFDKYKIISYDVPFIRKNIFTTECSFYLHLCGVRFTDVSPNVFASTVSLIPSLECVDYYYDDDYVCIPSRIPSSHWKKLSRTDGTRINELRIWFPTMNNLEHFVNIKAKTLQLICTSKDELKKVLVNIANSAEKTMKVFVVKYDENDYDYYEEIVVFSAKTMEEFKNNYTTYILQLDEISKFVPYYEGEQHLKNWCCEIRVIEGITVSENNEESKDSQRL